MFEAIERTLLIILMAILLYCERGNRKDIDDIYSILEAEESDQ